MAVPDDSFWLPGVPSGDDTIPTLVVEVASPRQSRRELRQKCRDYRDEGVQVCWLVDPERRAVEVFEGERDGELLREGALASPLLPGLSIDLVQIFAAAE
jgi:Uma2 family endonuclease